MDEEMNAGRDEKGAEGGFGGLVETLLKNPELLTKISGMLSGLNNPGSSPGQDAPAADGDTEGNPVSHKPDDISKKFASLLENRELMSMLPGILSGLKPPASSDSLPAGAGHGGGPHHGHHGKAGADKKVALMCALKPYMSGRRREMIDYLIRINKLGDIFQTLT